MGAFGVACGLGALVARKKMDEPKEATQPIASSVPSKTLDLKMSIKQNSQLLSTCIYIAFAIAFTQVISSAIQKYFIDNPNPLAAFLMFIIIVVLYGGVIFILVKISPTFKKFLLRMFGAKAD